MKKLTQKQVNEMIKLHGAWLDVAQNGKRAYFSNTDLRGINLEGADLRGANLEGADLRGVNLRRVQLCGADFTDANLFNADLTDADLRYAILINTNLRNTNLEGVNLSGADITGTDLNDAKLHGAILPITYNKDVISENDIKGMTEQDFIIHTLEKNGTNIDEIRELYQKMKSFGYV